MDVDGREGAGGGADNGDAAEHSTAELEPREGMEFGSCEEATAFYYEYASREGFRVTRKCSHRSKRDNRLMEVQFVCYRYGKKREKPNALFRRYSMKMECRAAMFVRRKEGASTWLVHFFVKDHNHELENAGDQTRLPRSPRGEDCDEPRVALQPAADASAVLEFCVHMQQENPDFFYALSLDDDRRVKNVLWIDAKARHDYSDFGDAVFLDAGCITNKYRLPLATLSGVDNQGEALLFGCALLADETASSFVWLMKTWLGAVGGQAPKAITLVRHEAIKTAAKDIFPCSTCRFSTRHISKEVSEKLGHITHQDKSFMEKFDKCLYKSLTDEDFERRWSKMIAKFELQGHEWLQSLLEDRRFWVPTFLRETFFGEEVSSSHSDSVYSFFGRHVSKKTTLKEFLERYEEDLHDRYEKEAAVYFQSQNVEPELKSLSPYELQMSFVYTGHVFVKFQVEVLGTHACQAKKVNEEGSTSTYCVKDLEECKEFMVTWNHEDSKVSCLCCLFEFKGYLCRHAMVVLQFAGVPKIPSHYILKRWTKDARKSLALTERPSAAHSRLQRYNHLYRQVTRFAHDCSISEEGCSILLAAIEEAMTKFNCANSLHPGHSDPENPLTHLVSNFNRKRKQ